MATFSEVGHGKNVANFEDLISFCTGYGATYNPFLNAIKLAQLNTLKTSAINSITLVSTTFTTFKNATNNREIAFEPLKKLTTKVMAALKACGANDQTMKDATTINHKIQGTGKLTKADAAVISNSTSAVPNPTPDPELPKEISNSQQSYDSKIEFFSKMIDLLTSIAAYTPNENELKLTGLNATLLSMKTTNTAVINAYTAWSNARISRTDILYKAVTGLVDISLEVKAYVKSLFGATSLQYKQVTALKFVKVK
ncbi:MAG: hypothetical protein WAT21_11825 [Saprospiraceae bacterium]